MIQVMTKSLEFHKYTNRIHQHFQLHELQGLLDETPLERTPEISHSKVMCIKNRKKGGMFTAKFSMQWKHHKSTNMIFKRYL